MSTHGTHFSRLSVAAQTFIVDAAMGVYDNGPPEHIPEDVAEEIRQWIVSDEQISPEEMANTMLFQA
jgi:hypothetical protein